MRDSGHQTELSGLTDRNLHMRWWMLKTVMTMTRLSA